MLIALIVRFVEPSFSHLSNDERNVILDFDCLIHAAILPRARLNNGASPPSLNMQMSSGTYLKICEIDTFEIPDVSRCKENSVLNNRNAMGSTSLKA